jgi:peptidoglycan/LPS O-acetylase OafA/YrhL
MGTFRFLLALAVAIDHANGLFGNRMISGLFAVQSFYVVSGFLIAHILTRKYPDTREGLWLFYSNRALRIFIPYWTVLAVTVLASLFAWFAVGNAFNIGPWLTRFSALDASAQAFLILANLLISGQDLSLWLVVDGGRLSFAFNALTDPRTAIAFNIVTPAWTVALELIFYAIAPFLVRRRTAVLLVIFVAVQFSRFYCYRAGFYNSALDYRFFPFELALFVLGILSHRLYLSIEQLVSDRAAVIVTGILGVSVVLYPQSRYLLDHQYQYYLLVSFALPFLFVFTRRRALDGFMGELSYPIYLVHWPVQQFVSGLTDPAVPFGGWYSVCSVGLSLVAALVLARMVVAPLERWRARRYASSGETAFAREAISTGT